MRLKVHTNNMPLRIGATVLAIGYGCVGWFAIDMSMAAPTDVLADRAWWLGITFVLAAVLALSVSWLVADLSNIWCIPPRSSKLPRINIATNEHPEGRGSKDPSSGT